MKTLLISTPVRFMTPYHRRTRGCMPPLNLLYLASSLLNRGHEAMVLDTYSDQGITDAEILARAAAFSPGLIGIPTYTVAMPEAFSLAALLKKALPQAKIVFGGIHASYLPAECLKDANVDLVVIGEGEDALPEIADALDAGRPLETVKGLAFRSGGKDVFTPPRPESENMDAKPLPAWHLAEFDRYYMSSTRAASDKRAASTLSMRGCSYNCVFCTHSFCYKTARLRKPAAVADEIQLLSERYGVGQLQFEDSTFTCSKEHVLEICRLIKERGLKIAWNCNIRANNMDDEMFAAMKSAGCANVLLGVESGSQTMLNAMKKGTTIEQIRRTVAMSKKHGIRLNASFLIGVPGETRESAIGTYRFARELDPDYVIFSALVPSVGSELFDKAVAERKINSSAVKGSEYLQVYAEQAPLVEMSSLSSAELASLMERFTRGFYLRPNYILKRLIHLTSLNELRGAVSGLTLIMVHQFRRLMGRVLPVDDRLYPYTGPLEDAVPGPGDKKEP